jgi:hypothetical protein
MLSDNDEYVNCDNCDNKIKCDNCYWKDEKEISKIILPDYRNINPKPFLGKSKEKIKSNITLCRNEDCLRYPDDALFDKDNEDSEWIKCSLCDGYFNDNGLNDILFIEEKPNNYQHSCDLCGKTKNIVQMKGTSQYICQNACDESDEDSD